MTRRPGAVPTVEKGRERNGCASQIGTILLLKRLAVGFTILAGSGALAAVVFTIISGVQYRIREDQGLQPEYAPAWIVFGTCSGLWLFALGAVGLATTGVVALLRRRRSKPPEHAADNL